MSPPRSVTTAPCAGMVERDCLNQDLQDFEDFSNSVNPLILKILIQTNMRQKGFCNRPSPFAQGNRVFKPGISFC